MSASLRPLEAAFLDWEDSEGDDKHFAWAMVFDPLPGGEAPSLEAVRDRVSERLPLFPRFRERLSATRVGRLARPRWVPDAMFDIARHVDQATLPPPGGRRELLAWLAELSTRRVDRRHPVWHLTLLTGLDEGRWAAVFKVHHCMIDGAGAVVSFALLTDGTRHSAGGIRSEAKPEPSSAGRLRALRMTLSGARTLGRIARQRPGPPAGTSLMVGLGPNRHLAFLDMPLARLKAIRSSLGGTVNDVAMTAVVGGLRALFEHRGEVPLPDHLHVLVPVNMRTPSEAHSLAMNLSFSNLAVPLADEDLERRYLETARSTEAMKRSGQVASDQTLENLAALLPPAVERALSRYVSFAGHFDVMVTNVPGPQAELAFMGAPLHRVLPVVPPTTGHAIHAIVCSYSGILTLGFNADRDAVPDLDVVRTGTQRTLEELGHLAARGLSR